MANITTTGTTSYPSSIDTRTALTDGAAGDQIVANHPNGLGAAVLAIETELGTDPAGSVADVSTRLGVALNNDGTVRSSVVTAGGGAAVSYSSGVFTVSWSPDGPGFIQNLGLEITANASVANALRVRLVQRSGATPTSAAPIRIAFPVATVSAAPANGAYVVREVTSDTALQITSGSSFGTLVNERARIYVGALDNNGTVEACAWNPKSSVFSTTSSVAARVFDLYTPSEVATLTTTSEGGAGGADSAATVYSTSARTGVFVRKLGYFDVTLGTTVGNWSNNPDLIRLVGPGIPTTGDRIQSVSTSTYGITRTGTTAIPNDGTIPQISEGDPYMWATMTHTNPVNPTLIEGLAFMANGTAGVRIVAHVHRNSETNALFMSEESDGSSSGNFAVTIPMRCMVSTATSGATGYYMLGGGAAGTTTFNGEGAANRYGDASPSHLSITEICA